MDAAAIIYTKTFNRDVIFFSQLLKLIVSNFSRLIISYSFPSTLRLIRVLLYISKISKRHNNNAQRCFQVQGQYQVIPAYYDQNGSIVMGGVRGLSSAATPMRLVSPAPVLVNRAPSQPPPGPPAPPPPSLYSQATPTSHSNAAPGECLGKLPAGISSLHALLVTR